MNHNLLYSPDMLLEAQAASQMYKSKKVISQLEFQAGKCIEPLAHTIVQTVSAECSPSDVSGHYNLSLQ